MSDEPEETGPVLYRIGDKDASGRIITDILGRDSNEYGSIVVYLARELKGSERAYWEFHKESSGLAPEYLAKITDEFDRLKTLIAMSPLPHEHIKLANVEAGKALVNSFRKLIQDESANHTDFFLAANNYLSRSAEQSSRFLYVGAGLCAFIIFSTFGFVIGYLGILPLNEEHKILFFCSVGGATGAVISMIQRGQKISVNPFSTSNYLCFEGACRIFLGVLFSIVLYVGIQSGIVLSLAKHNSYALVFLSIISGFNERFVKELMKSSEKEMLEQ